MAAPKYRIQVRNQFGGWQQYQTVHNLPSASKSAQKRAEQTGKQHRIMDEDGNLVEELVQETYSNKKTIRQAKRYSSVVQGQN